MADQPPNPEYQRWVFELQRQDAHREHDNLNETLKVSIGSANDSASLALRTAVLINGGAAVSVLAFRGGSPSGWPSR
jgi:hypothetical protein